MKIPVLCFFLFLFSSVATSSYLYFHKVDKSQVSYLQDHKIENNSFSNKYANNELTDDIK